MATITITKTEGSARPAVQSGTKALIIGPSSGGVKESKIYTFAQQQDVNSQIGYGPAADLAQLVMSRAPAGFGSVDVIISSGSVSPTLTQEKAASPTIEVGSVDANGPYNSFDVRVEITTAGTPGTGSFKYSLDGGATFSAPTKMPDDGNFIFPNTNMSASFADSTHSVGNDCHYVSTAPMLNATDLSNCFSVLNSQTTVPTLIAVAADSADPAECSALFSVLDTNLTALDGKFKYTQAVLPAGGESKLFNREPGEETGTYESADVLTETNQLEATVGNIIQVVAERTNVTHPIPQVGRAKPRLPFAYVITAEQHAVGTDYSRLISDTVLQYITDPSYDDFLDGKVYEVEKVGAPRSYTGEAGFGLNQSLVKSAPNSTFKFWPVGRIVQEAAKTAKAALRPFLNRRVKVLSDGTGRIDPVEAAKIDTSVNKALRAKLVNVTNGEGTRGHVSAILYRCNTENNLLSTSTLEGTLQITPLGYIENITVLVSLEDEIQAG